MNDISLSVVIGFRDWGLDRLSLSIKSLIDSFGQIDGEVIVSDYGSADPRAVEEAVTEAGGTYLRVETTDVWSRSRALNAGLAIAKGDLLACTDADMLFTPGTVTSVVDKMKSDGKRFFVLQCRDLPPALDAAGVQRVIENGIDWNFINRSARLRPRWGMGGFIVMPRAAFETIRGLDERMEVYGGEDIDLANRLRRAGYRLEWLQDPNARMFHIWHPPTRNIASQTERGSEAILRNRSIMLEDKTAVRNLDAWMFRPKKAKPPITVAIATYNRSGTILDSVYSVLSQTMPDFELIVMDDGSTDDTQEVLSTIEDSRLRILSQDNSGVAAARNRILAESRGEYTVVHDSDDLMPPWRLRAHLENLAPQVHGNYGAAVNFDDTTGDMTLIRGKLFSAPALIFNSQVLLHGTMMVETELLRRVGYNSSLRSGTDYNLNVRLAKLGVKMTNTGELHLLRRAHAGQMTEVDSTVQKLSSNLTNAVIRSQYGRTNEQYHRRNRHDDVDPVYTDEELISAARPYLPDHLVKRGLLASQRFGSSETGAEAKGDWLTRESLWSDTKQKPILSAGNLTWREMAELSRDFRIERATLLDSAEAAEDASNDAGVLDSCVEFARQTLDEYKDIVDNVFVSIYEQSGCPNSRPDTLIARARLNHDGGKYVCRISSVMEKHVSEPLYLFRLGTRNNALPEASNNGVNP